MLLLHWLTSGTKTMVAVPEPLEKSTLDMPNAGGTGDLATLAAPPERRILDTTDRVTVPLRDTQGASPSRPPDRRT